MGKMTREQLASLREQKSAEMGRGTADPKTISLVVGMGTSGIAAGARETFARLESELAYHGVTDVVLKQTGSLGLDHAEPTVEVRMPGMPPVVYGNVDEDVAAKIVRKHVVDGRLVNSHVFDHPAADIVRRRAAVSGGSGEGAK